MTNQKEKRKVPELRFPEFSGEWEEKKLNEIASFYKGKGISKSDISEDGVNCILYGELYTKYGFQINEVYSRTDINENTLFEGFKNDVLVPSSGETAIDIATASSLNVNNTYLGGDINVIRPNDAHNGHFISLSINGKNKKELSKLAQGKTVVHLYNNELKKLKINFPSIKEQQKIGEFFSKLDRQIELEEKKLALLEEQKKGYMQKIFSQELRFKDEHGEDYPEWEKTKLKNTKAIFTDGNYGESYPKESDFVSKEGIPFIRGNNLVNGEIILENVKFISYEKNKELVTGQLLKNDIVISVRGSIGQIGFVSNIEEGSNINSQLAIIRIKDEKINNKFLNYYFLSKEGQKEISKSITGTALKQLPINKMKEVNVIIPTIEEQLKIILIMDNISQIIKKQKKKIKLLDNKKKYMLNALLY